MTPKPGTPVIPPVTPFTWEYPGLNPIPFPRALHGSASARSGSSRAQPTGRRDPADVTRGAGPSMLFRRSTSLCDALAAAGSQSTGPYPANFQGFIDDPNSVLRDAIAGQDILGFIEINLTTDTLSTNGFPTLGVGSLYETVSNIPFLGVANRTPPSPSARPTGYRGDRSEPRPQRLRLFGKRNLLDRMGAQPGSAADTAA